MEAWWNDEGERWWDAGQHWWDSHKGDLPHIHTDIASLVALILTVLTIFQIARNFTAAARTRARLATLVDIWSKMPKSYQRDKLRAVVLQTTDKLVILERPFMRVITWVFTGILLALLCGIFWLLYLASELPEHVKVLSLLGLIGIGAIVRMVWITGWVQDFMESREE